MLLQCHHDRSVDAYLHGMFADPPRKLAIVGCGCSVATEPVAELSHHWNISQVRLDVYVHRVYL